MQDGKSQEHQSYICVDTQLGKHPQVIDQQQWLFLVAFHHGFSHSDTAREADLEIG